MDMSQDTATPSTRNTCCVCLWSGQKDFLERCTVSFHSRLLHTASVPPLGLSLNPEIIPQMRTFRFKKPRALALVIAIAAFLTFVEAQTPSATPRPQLDCTCKVNKKCAPASECTVVGYVIGGVIGAAVLTTLTSYIVIAKVQGCRLCS